MNINYCNRTLGLDSVELLFIHVKSDKMTSVVQEQPMHQAANSDVLHVEIHDVKAYKHGISICNRMLNLVRSNYGLSATSITGIPMKVFETKTFIFVIYKKKCFLLIKKKQIFASVINFLI